MKYTLTAERVHALAEGTRQMAYYRPKGRRGSQIPQACRGEKLQATRRQSCLADIAFEEVELRHGLLKPAVGRLGSFVHGEWALPEAHETVGHGHFGGQRLQGVHPFVRVFD